MGIDKNKHSGLIKLVDIVEYNIQMTAIGNTTKNNF